VRKLLVLSAALVALVIPAAASAHPLGNFTVNRYVEVRPSGEDLYVRYALDLAEIPTVQLGDRVRHAGFPAEIARGLVVRVDGRRVFLSVVSFRVRARPGAGGLETLRFEAVYSAGAAGRSLAIRDTNFESRIGWREIVTRADHGARIERSTAPAASKSDGLRTYPRDLLSSPLDVSVAEATLVPGDRRGAAPRLGPEPAAERESSGFESLVSRDLTPGFVLVSLLLAMFWGAAHAFSPGHGKAIVAGYLVGTRGTARHAFALGGIVTVTHTVGVFALGLVTLALSEFFVPEQLYPWLNLVAALLVVGVGLAILRSRLRPWLDSRAHARAHAHARDVAHDHSHHHGHHHHGHDHHHHGEPGSGWRGLLGVGISGGIVPCPTALVVLLAAISLHRVGYGLVLILAFSFGLAASITGIGLLAVTAKRVFGRLSFEGRLIRALPAVSALVVLVLGVAMTVRAVPDLI
jgi:ABC-type nickel/cobalt efflux system permease component RcnA